MERQPHPLKLTRQRQGWSQEQAIVRIEALGRSMGIALPARTSLRTLLSLFENGRRPVPQQYWPIFRELYRATDEELGLHAAPQILAFPTPPGLPTNVPTEPVPEILDYLHNVLAEHVRADALVGPRFLVPTVQSQMPLIGRLCQVAKSDKREMMLRIGARFAEFCGWLYQDSGQAESAVFWTNQALDYANELGDPRLIAYVLMRKSNIITEAGSPGHGLGLANAALKAAKRLTPQTRAVSLRQRARAHAMVTEPGEFERDIMEALDEAADSAGQPDDLAGYCTPSYVEMEAGISWLELGNPCRAVETCQQSLSNWPEGSQSRDRGLCLARLATAAAVDGEPDLACESAVAALMVAKRTGSARINAQLRAAYNRLAPLAAQPVVRDVRRQLAELTAG